LCGGFYLRVSISTCFFLTTFFPKESGQIDFHSTVRTQMKDLIAITSPDDVPTQYKDTPIGLLLEYHNLGRASDSYTSAQLLIGMCMDNRKHLHIPDNFAFIIRSGGGNLRYSEFKVSYAIAVGGVRSIALIGHTQCGMVNLIARKNLFVRGLVDQAGWTADSAQDHFFHFAPMFEIGNEIDFTLSEAKRLRLRYPKIMVAPLIYRVEDNKLYFIEETM
jgi:carbonic anhydrase